MMEPTKPIRLEDYKDVDIAKVLHEQAVKRLGQALQEYDEETIQEFAQIATQQEIHKITGGRE